MKNKFPSVISVPTILFLFSITAGFFSCGEKTTNIKKNNINYVNNWLPLTPNPYIELPPGSVKPEGWLMDQLVKQKNGLTGHLDEIYQKVVGPRNGWLGGDGDGWERGPYWLDGLVPLAYTLNDSTLIAKVKPWIEWSINHQDSSGYFGPVPFKIPPDPEPGLQKGMRRDWWPKIVMLKVLRQYYEATGDKRVITLMLKYFHYQLAQLPVTPLDHWSFWANRRGGDNLMVVYWLYNITGEKFLLDLAELIHKQTFPYTEVFRNTNCTRQSGISHLYPYNTGNKYPFNEELIHKLCIPQIQSFHGVNIAQGIKEPVVYFQAHRDSVYLQAVNKALNDLALFHGQAQGMYGADEPTHGNDPQRGIELCSVVEMMYSLENMLTITGDINYADLLEKIAYNALPAQTTDDYSARQYFQSANQVSVTRANHGFYEDENHGGTSLCYGVLTGYPCCTCNMHQGWPKYVRNLFYASDDNGVAAMLFGPCRVNMLVGDHERVNIVEETFYPFNREVVFHIDPNKDTEFPFHLRIPSWCNQAVISINGEETARPEGGTVYIINRTWKKGDILKVIFPMHITVSRWYMNTAAIERGPLVYSLAIKDQWRYIRNTDRWGNYWEVLPESAWNYGLVNEAISNPPDGFSVTESRNENVYPWNPENTPVVIRTIGKKIPSWKMYHANTGPVPTYGSLQNLVNEPSDSISLIPYGCTSLRITEFPVLD